MPPARPYLKAIGIAVLQYAIACLAMALSYHLGIMGHEGFLLKSEDPDHMPAFILRTLLLVQAGMDAGGIALYLVSLIALIGPNRLLKTRGEVLVNAAAYLLLYFGIRTIRIAGSLSEKSLLYPVHVIELVWLLFFLAGIVAAMLILRAGNAASKPLHLTKIDLMKYTFAIGLALSAFAAMLLLAALSHLTQDSVNKSESPLAAEIYWVPPYLAIPAVIACFCICRQDTMRSGQRLLLLWTIGQLVVGIVCVAIAPNFETLRSLHLFIAILAFHTASSYFFYLSVGYGNRQA